MPVHGCQCYACAIDRRNGRPDHLPLSGWALTSYSGEFYTWLEEHEVGPVIPPATLAARQVAEEDEEEEEEEEEDERPVCGSCSERYDEGDGTEVRVYSNRVYRYVSEDWCPNCADDTFVCDCCYRHYQNNYSNNTADGETVCDNCVSAHYYRCEDCDGLFHCDSDHSCRSDESDDIMSYGTDPLDYLRFHGEGPVFYGVELEMECGTRSNSERAAAEIKHRMGDDFVIVKTDGSLSEGIEVVTAPADVATHRARWVAGLGNRLSGCRSWDTSTCGMHVHVSRKPLSDLTIGKVVAFVNDEDNDAFVTDLAGRGSGTYCYRSYKRVSSVRRWDERRYAAVNLCNDATIEFRMFRGSLNPERVIRNIEFCEALVTWAGSSASASDLRAAAFVSWVGAPEQRKRWPFLVSWLRATGRLPPKKESARRPPAPSLPVQELEPTPLPPSTRYTLDPTYPDRW